MYIYIYVFVFQWLGELLYNKNWFVRFFLLQKYINFSCIIAFLVDWNKNDVFTEINKII